MPINLEFEHNHKTGQTTVVSDRDANPIGIQYVFGKVSDLDPVAQPFADMSQQWAIAVQHNSDHPEKLDGAMAALRAEWESRGLKDVFITKSTHPKDDRWFIMGNVQNIAPMVQGQKGRYIITEWGWCDALRHFTALDKD